jgi:hypothetical protein
MLDPGDAMCYASCHSVLEGERASTPLDWHCGLAVFFITSSLGSILQYLSAGEQALRVAAPAARYTWRWPSCLCFSGPPRPPRLARA